MTSSNATPQLLFARFEWKVEDFWIGVFWRTTIGQFSDGAKRVALDVWICLLPCVPLHITYWYQHRIYHDAPL